MSQRQEATSRRNIERLLRELSQVVGWDTDGLESGRKYAAARNAYDALYSRLQEKMEKLTMLLAHRRAMEKAEAVWKAERDSIREKLSKIRQKFYAYGPTPALVQSLNKLIDQVHGK